ncbi:unnamed protein product, partial [Polarella glacialis]
AQLIAASQQVGRLQARIDELETESTSSAVSVVQLNRQLDRVSGRLRLSEEQGAANLKEAEGLRKEATAARKQARDQAAKESDATLSQVREEMEKELEHLCKQKDDQVRSLEAKLAAAEKLRREQSKEIEKLAAETGSLRDEVSFQQSDGAGKSSDNERKFTELTAKHACSMEDLEARLCLEERQKHELALNLRSVEARSRADLAQLEAQKTQIELQFS